MHEQPKLSDGSDETAAAQLERTDPTETCRLWDWYHGDDNRLHWKMNWQAAIWTESIEEQSRALKRKRKCGIIRTLG